MPDADELIKHPANDLGGRPAEPLVIGDHELRPWEKHCHALLDVLDRYKLVNTEEKRRGVDDLGGEIYEHWLEPAPATEVAS